MTTSYLGEVFALLTALSWSIGIFPFTEAARRLGPNEVNHFRLLLAVVFLALIFVFATSQSPLALFTASLPEQWLWFGISGVLGLALGDYFGFTAYAILGNRVASIFSTLAPGAALLLGYIILGERMNWLGVVGMAITLSGIAWVTLSKKEKAKLPESNFGKIEKGILFGVLSALCQGGGLVFAKKGMAYKINAEQISAIHATFIRVLVATVITYGITICMGRLKQINQPIKENKNQGIKYAIAGTVFGPVLGVIFSMQAVAMINVSVAQTIFSLVPIIVLLIGYFLYKEKISAKAALGAVIAITGVVILIWRNELTQLRLPI